MPRSKLPGPLHQRLSNYALAASTAGVSLLALAPAADAETQVFSSRQGLGVRVAPYNR